MAESQVLPTVIFASSKYVWKKSIAVIQVKHIMSIEMFAILKTHICKDIIQFRSIYYKKNCSTNHLPKESIGLIIMLFSAYYR